MIELKKLNEAFNNNRSRVATALIAVGTVLTYVIGDYLKVEQETLNFVVASIITPGVAYILGNGRYEAQNLLIKDIPAAPYKPVEKGKK